MNTIESLLAEHRAVCNTIVDSYILKFEKDSEVNRTKGEDFFNSVTKEFRAAIATSGTDIAHKSIVEGYSNQTEASGIEFTFGISKINLESTKKLMDAVLRN